MEMSERLKITALYDLYEQPMYRIAYAVLHDSALAEDAVSDAFIRIIGKLNKIGEPYSPKTKSYIVKVIKSTSINIYRRNKRRFEYEQPMDERTLSIPDRSAVVTDSSMLNGLNPDERRIIVLRCEKGMSWKEVAAEMSLNEATVRKRFERIKTKLKGEKYDET
jgi:RNA polymerase sigma-70 factor (ECF subfamily)